MYQLHKFVGVFYMPINTVRELAFDMYLLPYTQLHDPAPPF